MAEDRNEGTRIVAFLIGGLIGVGVGLLIAPITGPEARQRVKKAADIAKEKLTDLSHEIAAHSQEVMEQTKKILEGIKTHLTATAETIKEATIQKKEELKEKIQPNQNV